MRYSDDELAVIKSTFAENEALVLAIRKALMGQDMTKEEKSHVDTVFSSDEVAAVIEKTIAPRLDPDAPMFQQADLYIGMQLDFSSPERVAAELEVRKILADYMYDMMEVVKNPIAKRKSDVTVESLTPSESTAQAGINLMARNSIISHIDFQLNQLLILAGQRDETVEATKKRLQKDSAR